MATRRKAATKKTASKRAPKKTAAKKKATKKRATKKNAARKVQPKKTTAAKKRPARKKAPAKKPAAKSESTKVVPIGRYTTLSISQVALDTGMTRATVTKRIAESGVEPSGMERGYPVYRLKDILPALFTESDGQTDPDKLRPFERRAHYQAEQDKLKLQQDRGELVPSFEVERTLALLFKSLTHRLDTLPDELERECGLTGGAIALVEKSIDAMREGMYEHVISETLDDANSADEARA